MPRTHPAALPPRAVAKALAAEARQLTALLNADRAAGRAALDAFHARAGLSSLHAAYAGYLRGHVAFIEGRYVDAEAEGRAAHASAVQHDHPPLGADAAILLGNVELERAEYVEATHWYTTAAGHLERGGDAAALGRVHNNLGLVAWRMRDLARAEEHFDRALRLFGPHADPRTLGTLHNNLGLVYEDSGDSSAAEASWRQAIALLAPAGDANYHANALSNLGELMESRGQHAEARALQEEALALRIAIGHPRGEVSSRIALARTALAQGDAPAAAPHVEAALALARRIGLRKQEADALALHARLLERGGAYAEALRVERQVADLRALVFGEQMTARVAELQLRFDTRQARADARRAATENAMLQTALADAARASAVRDRFLATVSQELRTPLSAALEAAGLLRRGRLDDRNQRLVDVVLAATEALGAAIDDLLLLSRGDDVPLLLAEAPLDLHDIVDQVVAIVAGAAAEKGLELRNGIAPDVPRRMLGDAPRLRQLLLNLTVNAIRYTERGHVALAVSRDEDRLCVRVSDTGVGIAPDEAAAILAPFSARDDSGRPAGGPGVGLGLCRRILDAMGGTVALDATPGAGSVFTVHLPIHEADAAPPPGDDAPFDVLLVEDDPTVREVLTEVLLWCGARVRAAASGEEALARYAEAPADVVMLDICMPLMDGFTCARLLRERHGPVRVIGVSGSATGDEGRTAADARFDGWLPKPASAHAIRDELARLGFGKPAPGAPTARPRRA